MKLPNTIILPRILLNLSVLGLVFFILSSCSPDDSDSGTAQPTCNSKAVGTWKGQTINDKMIFRSDESYSYEGDDGCTSSGTYACPGDTNFGTLIVTIKTASYGNCGVAGVYRCGFLFNDDDTLLYNCGGGDFSYTRE